MTPSWRKPFGILIILLIIALWAALVANLSPWIGQMYWLLQAIAYAILGIIWIAPLKPLLRWMETGKFR